MSPNNSKGKQVTISESAVNHRADERERLLAGLQLFVNTGDSEEDYRTARMQIPSFWPLVLQGPSGPSGLDQALEWPDGGQLLFRAFRDYLRRLWRSDFYRDDGSKADTRYLEYLLGFETRYAVDPPGGLLDAELPNHAFTDGWTTLRKQYPGVYCVRTVSVAPTWNTAKLDYLSTCDFQRAVYELLSASWRARVCRRCGKYFIADKPAQMSCSTNCSNQTKNEIGRRYWHETGATLRELRAKTASPTKKEKAARIGTKKGN